MRNLVVLRLAAVLACGTFTLLAPVGCDRFFVLEVTVTGCESGRPLAGVSAHLKLDKGVGEEDHFATTTDQGRLSLLMNEAPNAWATLSLEAAGYETWSRQFRGAPENPIGVCLRVDEGAEAQALIRTTGGPTRR